MRTTLLLAASVLLATLVAGGASAIGLVSIDVGLGDVGVAAEASPSPEASIPAIAVEAPTLVAPIATPALLEPSSLVDLPLAGAPVVRALAPPEAPRTLADDREPAPPAPATVQAVAATGILWLLVERLGFGRAAGAALAALYFRVQPNELLEHERRERVIELVRGRPGIGPQEISQALGTGWGVTSYHLDRLERAGLVTSQRVGQHRCYFLPGAVPRAAQQAVGIVRGDTSRRVAALVAQKPGLTQSQLCAELGLSASAASKQLARLEAAALVRREAGAGGQRVFPGETLGLVTA